jgi:hypothetical protein
VQRRVAKFRSWQKLKKGWSFQRVSTPTGAVLLARPSC